MEADERCMVCNNRRYGGEAVPLPNGRWRHRDTDACLAAVGVELRALRTLIEACEGKQGTSFKEVVENLGAGDA